VNRLAKGSSKEAASSRGPEGSFREFAVPEIFSDLPEGDGIRDAVSSKSETVQSALVDCGFTTGAKIWHPIVESRTAAGALSRDVAASANRSPSLGRCGGVTWKMKQAIDRKLTARIAMGETGTVGFARWRKMANNNFVHAKASHQSAWQQLRGRHLDATLHNVTSNVELPAVGGDIGD
jgi:hypothetical protein